MATPQGTHRVLQKVPTTRMIGGEGSGYYDLPGIGFVTYFTASGVAVHGTYWHNDYGRPRSHGCVNVPTAASQWVYRWTRPDVPYDEQRVFADAQNATTIEVVY
jgi:lipoprotein-anchoring transpeptidase ErfK/SrfK